ncbi:putative ribosomal protein L1 [Rosa chinensis]|uniref:Putative ribosomal protein L1 n=1 Tax=Rosa chinensis TaxID=74649 RepID=A0A2P6S094_ROSCH|nr:ribosomal L1 domain-containing protein 1 [Rosa chinensis]PRQ52066.1 putative ribosomal protein L1 [Rosa chinensis]
MAAAITPAPSSSTPTPTKVSPKTARNAVNALLRWRNSKSEAQKPDILSSDELVYLVVSLKKIPPKGRVNAYKIPLPTPLHSQLTEFCLIYDDRPKSKLTKAQIQAKIKADNLPVVKILKYTKLKSDYKAFESKRKLLNSYDVFLADKQIVPLLPRLIGKQFFKKKKIPVPVDLLHKNWKEQIDRICGSALLFLSTGTCSVVRVARTSMREEEIVENVVSAISGIVDIVPGNWGGVRSLHLKLLESIPLPLYQTLPDEAVKVEGGEKVVEEVKEAGKGESKELKKEKVGKKKGMIHEVRYLDSSAGEVVDEVKSGKDSVGEGKVDVDEQLGGGELKKAKRKKEKVVGESNGKASENDGELRKSKRNKEKVVGELKRSKEQMEKLAKLVDEDCDFDVEVAEKRTKKVVNPKSGKVKGEDVEKQLKKSAKAKDAALNGEKPLKKLGKVKDDAGTIVKHKNDELSAKDKKKDVLKKKGDELSGKGGQAVGKKEKRKSEPVKLKSEEAKLKKAKRSK